jgi:hypothetical protein
LLPAIAHSTPVLPHDSLNDRSFRAAVDVHELAPELIDWLPRAPALSEYPAGTRLRKRPLDRGNGRRR